MIYPLKDFDVDLEVPKWAPSFFVDLVQSGEWERWELDNIGKAIHGHRVLEGGSCLGATAVILDRNAEFVVSLEANPKLAKIAEMNQKRNHSSAKIINAALGTKDGTAKFCVTTDLWSSSVDGKDNADKMITVKMLDTDKLVKKYRINAVVLDIEGEEEKILLNMDLTPIKVLVIELHAHIDKQAVVDRILGEGFIIKAHEDKGGHSVLWAERKPPLHIHLWRKLTDTSDW